MALTANLSRGIRNNNPLNIEHRDNNKWLGLAATPTDGRFCRFVSMDYGVRAAALLLMSYYDRYGIDTVFGIVSKWAPSHENDVSAYVSSVCQRMGVAASTVLDLHDRQTMRSLLSAMAKHETGTTLDEIPLNKGLALAGFAAPTNVQSVMTTPTMLAATTVAAPALAVTIGGIIDGIATNGESISAVVGVIGGPIAGSIALGVITAAAWGWNLYQRYETRRHTGV